MPPGVGLPGAVHGLRPNGPRVPRLCGRLRGPRRPSPLVDRAGGPSGGLGPRPRCGHLSHGE
eukprot:9636727-Lingulodinium_polyedra.AAC.1